MDSNATIRSPQNVAEWNAYYTLRWKLLRQPWGQAQGSEKDGEEAHAVHLIALVNDTIVACGRLHALEERHAQIRYMAVRHDYQKKGIGRAILSALEHEARKMGIIEINLNARNSCVGFYSKAGYHSVGPGPTLFANERFANERFANDERFADKRFANTKFSSIKHTKMNKKL
jgi:N-acetylglutamate synthase-like GNAT family acetyltransferase